MPRVTLGTRPQPQVGQSSADVVAMGRDARAPMGLDPRSVDELISFIEGGGDSTVRVQGREKRGGRNPKRRGGGLLGSGG